jgi:hypothetical protein
MPRAVSLIGMGVCASCPWLVIWSRELKQYETEAFASLVLALAVSRLLFGDSGYNRWRWPIVVAVTCLLAPWLGYGFLFAGVGLLLALAIVRPDACTRKFAILTAAASFCLMAISTVLILHLGARGQSQQKELLEYMAPLFIDPLNVRSLILATATMTWDASRIMMPYFEWTRVNRNILVVGAVIWTFIIIGLCMWPRRTRPLAVIWIFGAWAAMTIAASLKQYPFGAERMVVFLASPMAMAFAVGVLMACRYLISLTGLSQISRTVTIIATLLPVVYLAHLPVTNGFWVDHDFRTALAVLEQRRVRGEPVFVTLDAAEPVRFYMRGRTQGLTFEPYSNGTRPLLQFDYPRFTHETMASYGQRLWVITMGIDGHSRRYFFMDEARRLGLKRELVSESGADNSTGKAQLFLLSR